MNSIAIGNSSFLLLLENACFFNIKIETDPNRTQGFSEPIWLVLQLYPLITPLCLLGSCFQAFTVN